MAKLSELKRLRVRVLLCDTSSNMYSMEENEAFRNGVFATLRALNIKPEQYEN